MQRGRCAVSQMSHSWALHHALIARACEMAWARGLYVHYCGDSRQCEGPGLPDLLIAGPGGILWREVKSAAAPQVRADQQAWMRMLRAAGADVAVWSEEDYGSGRVEAELEAIR